MFRRLAPSIGLFLTLALAGTARADSSRFGPYDIRTVFVIAKNENKNQVHYGIHLDKDCMPIGKEPVYAYWQQLEEGPNVIQDLNLLDRTAYGINSQQVLKRTPEESKVLITLKPASDRGIAVVTRKRDGQCVADPIARINGSPARLERIFVHIAGFLRVDWIDIKGIFNGSPVIERVKR